MVQAHHVLVGGGTGFVGRHLVRLLKENGAKVRIVTRNPANKPDHISWKKIREEGLPKETTAVVNLAGRNILDFEFWTNSFKKEIYDSRIETNRTFVQAIHKATNKPKAFVTVSGVGYYKPDENKVYDEEWTQAANEQDFLAALARDWEKSSELDEQLAPSTRRVIIRSGVVLGHDGGVVKNMLTPFLMCAGGPIGDGKQWFPWIHVQDLVSMFKFAITNDHVTGVINGVAPEEARNRDFANAFATALGRPSFLPLPSFAVQLIFGSERSEILLKGQRVKSRAGLLGFRYEHSNLDEACVDVVKTIYSKN